MSLFVFLWFITEESTMTQSIRTSKPGKKIRTCQIMYTYYCTNAKNNIKWTILHHMKRRNKQKALVINLVQRDNEPDPLQSTETRNLHFFPERWRMRNLGIKPVTACNNYIVQTSRVCWGLTTSEYNEISDLTSDSAVSRKFFKTCKGGKC